MSSSYPNHYYETSSTSAPAPLRQHSKQSSEEYSPTPDKREQAHERQRRKRQQDRTSSAMTLNPEGTSDVDLDTQNQGFEGGAFVASKRTGGGKKVSLDNLPLEEARRKQRVREAARERQRKHRAAVKARRMAELGMAIVNEGGGIEQTAIGYTINEQGQYEAVLADPNNPNQALPPFPGPQTHATPGQMFASTLLLGLSCTPNLKQQLLRRLRSTNEDLAAFESFMAAAFDHWNNNRSMHYTAQVHHLPPSHMTAQSAPYAQPYLPVNESLQRPVVTTFPPSPPHGRHRSPSVSDETYRPDSNSDANLDHDSEHNASTGPSRESREAAVPLEGM